VLGLPDAIRACLFDLDGVLTPTAAVHAAAWKEVFDDFLRHRAQRTGELFVPFDPVADYDEYVAGRSSRRAASRCRRAIRRAGRIAACVGGVDRTTAAPGESRVPAPCAVR